MVRITTQTQRVQALVTLVSYSCELEDSAFQHKRQVRNNLKRAVGPSNFR